MKEETVRRDHGAVYAVTLKFDVETLGSKPTHAQIEAALRDLIDQATDLLALDAVRVWRIK